MSTPTHIGRYQVRERLGQGGMGVLYLALDPAIDRLVALKLLRVNQTEIRERFLREARLAARLQHPNIVTIFDVGEHEGQPFIAMEYIPGETLAEIIARRAPTPLGRRLEWLMDACRGLGFAHKHGVVHRDVKPANLMISRDSGTLKVLDFGIARGVDSQLTQAGMLIGTPSYMSPEQLEGRPLDHRSDIFALGLVLYEVLTYQQAFSGETPHAIWHKVISTQPRPLLEVNPSLDPALAGIVERLIAKRVEERSPDLEVLRSELQRVVQRLDADQASSTVVAPTPTPSSPVRRSGVARVAERRAAQIAAHVERAEAALVARDLERAQEAIEEAAMLAPDDSRVVALLDRLRHEQDAIDVEGWLAQAEAAMLSGALTEAAGLVDRALHTLPDHAPALGLRSAVQRAIETRERAQERARLIARALEQATEHLGAGAFDAAVRSVSEALGFDPQSRAALDLRVRIQRAAEARIMEVIGLARTDAAGERFGAALRRLQELTSRDERVTAAENEVREAWLAADRRKQAEESERRAREDAARRRDQARRDHEEAVGQAIARARALSDEGRALEAITALEAFQDEPPVAALVVSLRAAAAEQSTRARAEADRQARDAHDRSVMAAIARARELVQQQRGDEALAALQAFAPSDHRIVETLSALRRELQDRAASERSREGARAAEIAQRAQEEARSGQLGAAIARLEGALPRHPLIDEALAELRSTHERLAHETSARALTLASRGQEADAFALLRQFDPPHPAVSDALIRLTSESAAREARRQGEAAAQRRAADAAAERAALDAWVERQCELAQSALDDGRFGEARQLAQAVFARVPNAAEAVRLLDLAVAGQADAEAAAARRREIGRALARGADALEAGDTPTARMHLDAAAAVGASDHDLASLRRQIATVEAEREARQRQAAHDRRAQSAIDAARAMFEAGEHDAALGRLEAVDPPHPAVAAALTKLRAARERVEAERRRALEAERVRAAAAVTAEPAQEGPSERITPARPSTRRARFPFLATAAAALLAVVGTGVWLLQREAPVDGGEVARVAKPELPSTSPITPTGNTQPAPAAVVQPEPEIPSARPPEAMAVLSLVIDAAPWAQVTRIANAETQAPVTLEAERNTPYVAQLPAGVYEVTVQRFDRSQRRRVTLGAAVDNRVLFEFEAVDVDDYLRRVGS